MLQFVSSNNKKLSLSIGLILWPVYQMVAIDETSSWTEVERLIVHSKVDLFQFTEKLKKYI